MSVERRMGVLRGAALQGIVEALRETFDVGRCTLRLDVPGDIYPVVHESRAEGARTLIDDTEVDLREQKVVEIMATERRQEVQHDSRAAFNDPAFQRMLDSYGNIGAQIVTPVLREGELVGIISLHHLGSPRRWSDEEVELAAQAAGLVEGLL